MDLNKSKGKWKEPTISLGLTAAIRSVPTQPLSVLITYGAPDATSVNFALLAHAELTKSCEAPESNNIMMGCSLRKNIPVRTSSPMGISSTVV
jgi:hypothetical protein